MNKTLSWFEIPASDLKRAEAFYETILDVKLEEVQFGQNTIAVFPYDRSNASITGGALLAAPAEAGSPGGAIVYLHAAPIGEVLSRVERAGGKILQPKTELPGDIGFVARIADSEGNRIGLHGAS